MAWALQFNGVNDYVAIDVNHSPGATPVWEFEFKLSSGSEVSGFYRITGGSVSDSLDRILVNANLTEFRFYRSGVQKTWTGLSFAITDIFKLVQSGTSLELFINGASQGSIAGAAGIAFGVIGANFNTYSEMDLEYMRFATTDDSSLDRDYDATASSHSSGAPILSDISGNAQDGTGVNMPTDGSAWIDLGGGSPFKLHHITNYSGVI